MSVLVQFASKDAVNARKTGCENSKNPDLGRILIHLHFRQIPFIGNNETGPAVLVEKFAYDADTIYIKFAPIVKRKRLVGNEEADN